MGPSGVTCMWVCCLLLAGHVSVASSMEGPYEEGLPYAVYEDAAQGMPYWSAMVGAGPPSLSTAYAEAAMPSPRGTKSVVFGSLLLLLLLALTEWRVKGPQQEGSLEARIQKAQDQVADWINKPFNHINKQLEKQQKALSARLGLFMASLVFVLLGATELMLSARQRHNHKKLFPILRRAPSVTVSTVLALLVAAFAFYGFASAWPSVGASLEV